MMSEGVDRWDGITWVFFALFRNGENTTNARADWAYGLYQVSR